MTKIAREYERSLERVRERSLATSNVNLDVRQPVRRGDYAPADRAYAALLDKLDDGGFRDVPPALRADILRFYGSSRPGERSRLTEDDDDRKLREELAQLAGVPADR